MTREQEHTFAMTTVAAFHAHASLRRALLRELASAGWSHRMLAELYGVAHNTIRCWLREPQPDKRRARRR